MQIISGHSPTITFTFKDKSIVSIFPTPKTRFRWNGRYTEEIAENEFEEQKKRAADCWTIDDRSYRNTQKKESRRCGDFRLAAAVSRAHFEIDRWRLASRWPTTCLFSFFFFYIKNKTQRQSLNKCLPFRKIIMDFYRFQINQVPPGGLCCISSILLSKIRNITGKYFKNYPTIKFNTFDFSEILSKFWAIFL